MKRWLPGIFFCCLFWVGVSCSSSNEGGVGINVGNPTGTVPTTNLSPDFEDELPEDSLNSDSSTSSLSSFLLSKARANILQANDGQTSPAAIWDSLFIVGGVDTAREHRTAIATFLGEPLAEVLQDADITTASTTTQTTNYDQDLFGQSSWQIELITDLTDEDYIRLYFTNRDTGLLQATYTFTTDSDGNPVKGLFAYVNPDLITATPTEGTRMVALAFDFSDQTNNLLLMRVDEANTANGQYYTFHIHYQCDVTTANCVGEYLDTPIESQERQFYTTVRYDWFDTDREVCIAFIDYEGETELGDSQAFIGPDEPSEEEITTGCTIDTPYWDEHAYVVADLPMRFNDTDPNGGTALAYYVDGISKTGWDSLTPSLIDSWLDASGF